MTQRRLYLWSLVWKCKLYLSLTHRLNALSWPSTLFRCDWDTQNVKTLKPDTKGLKLIEKLNRSKIWKPDGPSLPIHGHGLGEESRWVGEMTISGRCVLGSTALVYATLRRRSGLRSRALGSPQLLAGAPHCNNTTSVRRVKWFLITRYNTHLYNLMEMQMIQWLQNTSLHNHSSFSLFIHVGSYSSQENSSVSHLNRNRSRENSKWLGYLTH